MASTEDKAYEIMRELDVDYVLVIFGGLTGYSSDGKHFSYLFANKETYWGASIVYVTDYVVLIFFSISIVQTIKCYSKIKIEVK